MEDEIALRHPRPVLVILAALLAFSIGFVAVGPVIGFYLVLPFYDGSAEQLLAILQSPFGHPEAKMPSFVLQGFATLVGTIIAPLIILQWQRKTITDFLKQPLFIQPIFLVIITTIVFTIANSVVIDWNQNIQLPGWLGGFETWAKDLEEKMGEQTEYLTQFDSPALLYAAILVIAILPAIGEELLFRGVFQNEFYRATQNIHVSIWISAAIFSAIHMQFYGFVPRMLLGALFGYLYYWSGSLTMAILAHFINNGFSVLALYFYQQGKIDIDIETNQQAPWPAVLSSMVATAAMLYFFKRFYDQKRTAEKVPSDGASPSF